MINLKALRLSELENLAVSLGEPTYRGRQLYRWLYGRGASSLAEMTDLPLTFRKTLQDKVILDTIVPERFVTATDETVKGLFRLSSGRYVEAVLIPDVSPQKTRLTVCVSSQVGCAMGCSFCATGQMGFREDLTPGEIFDQAWRMNALARERYDRQITNIVFMGMGEPLLNYDNVLASLDMLTFPDGLALAPRRITISTVGLSRRIRQLAEERSPFNLAVSLHAPTEEKRSYIMPVSRRSATSLAAVTDALQYYTSVTGRKVTFEYCMFQDFNDSASDAHHLARICQRIPSKVNLIMYNRVEGLHYTSTTEDRLEAFIRVLVDRGVIVTVRRSRGQDIDAACGQLANRSMVHHADGVNAASEESGVPCPGKD